MTVLQLASRLPQLADETTVTTDLTAYGRGHWEGRQEGFALGMHAGVMQSSPRYEDDRRLVVIPRDFVAALRWIDCATFTLPTGWMVVVGEGDALGAEDIEVAWSRLCKIRAAVEAEAAECGLPVMRRAELPERISSIRWVQDGQPVIVGRLHLGP